MKNSDVYWLWLASMTEASLNSKAALIEAYGTAENAFLAEPGEFFHVDGISQRDAELFEQRDLSAADRIPELCRKENIRILTMDDPEYPQRLKNIYAPPYVLYVKGNLPEIDKEPIVAIVGTRRATAYGKRMSRDIGYQYARCGGIVASGLTGGIEECAAEAVLAAGGKVIGYLGTAIPMAAGELAEKVAEKGALISEYAPETPTQRIFFRHRNRIGAGISAGVCAVEAPLKSGTVLFVSEALEQGKEIFAVPGNADSEASAGIHRFIREGATLVTSGSQIAEELLPMFPDRLNPFHDETYRSDKAKKVIDKENSDCYIDKSDVSLEGLTDVQKKIVIAVANGSCTVDSIIQETGIATPILLSQLTILEIKKKIRKDREKGFVIPAENAGDNSN